MEIINIFKRQLAAQREEVSKVTLKNYLSDIRHFVNWFEKSYKRVFTVEDLTASVITEYKDAQGATLPRKSSGEMLSTSSMKRHLSSLRKLSSLLTKDGIITVNPFEVIPQPTTEEVTDYWHLKSFKDSLLSAGSSKLTVKNYLSDIQGFGRWYEEAILPNLNQPLTATEGFYRINEIIIEEYKKRLFEIQGAAPRTINRKLSSLRKYLDFATRKGFIKDEEIVISHPTIEVKESTNEPEEKISLERIHEVKKSNKPTLSPIPPVRLFQRLLILPYLALEEGIATKIAAVIAGKQIIQGIRLPQLTQATLSEKSILRNQNIKVSELIGVKNVSKEFYAPSEISTQGFPIHKRLAHHARFTRPSWYKRYHNYAFVHYIHFSLLVIFAAGVGVALYQNLVQKDQAPTFAAPTSPPRILSFQGRLTDNLDNPITTPTSIRFGIYNDPVASGGAMLWQEVQYSVAPDQDGIFSVLLGTNTSIPSTVFSDNSSLYLGVTISSTSELAPRQRIATVAYASNSEFLQGMQPITAGGTSNVILALDSSGNLTIGGSANPTFEASGGQFRLSGQPLVLATNTGSNANIYLQPDGLGKIDLQKPLVNTSDNGNITPGGVEVNDRFGVLATESANAAFIVNNNSTGDIFAASSAGTTRFQLASSGVITASAYATDGGILYANGAGTFLQTTVGALGQCLQSAGGGSPIWGSCGSGASNYWTIANGAIYPVNESLDMLIGGTASTSAKFGFINVGSGNPTATIAGNLGLGSPTGINPSTFLNVLNGGSFDLRTSVGGDSGLLSRLFIGNAGGVGLGTTTPASGVRLDVRGLSGTAATTSISAQSSGPALLLDNSLGDLIAGSSSGTTTFRVLANGDLMVGPNGTGKITAGIVDPYLIQNQYTVGNTALRFQTMASSNGDFVFENQSSELARLLQNGNLGLGVVNPTSKLQIAGDITPDTNGTRNIGTASLAFNTIYATNFVQMGGGTISGFWQRNQGALAPSNLTDDLLLGSTSTASAKFGFINVSSGTPTASISANSANNATYLTGDGTLATTNKQSLNLGSASTGFINVINGSGSIFSSFDTVNSRFGVGTAAPDRKLEVLDSINPQLRLTHTDSTFYADFQVNGSGDLTITPGGGDTNIGGTLDVSGNGAFGNNGAVASDRVLDIDTTFSSVATNTYGMVISPVANATITNAYGVHSRVDVGASGVITNAMGFYAVNPTNNGTINDNYGIRVADQTAGTNDIGISIEGADTQVLWLGSGANNTDAANGIAFGSSRDTNLYRSAANTLRTDDAFNINGTLNLSSAGVITGATGLTSSGTITFSGFSTNGGLLYTNASGVLAQTGAGTGTQCLLGGTTPTWGTCPGAAGSNWRIGLGAISPINNTLDLLVGSNASSSAKFAVLNVYSGTPVASISANSGNYATYITGDGTLATTNRGALTLGNSSTYNTTGNILINPNGTGQVAIGTNTPSVSRELTVSGSVGDIEIIGTGGHASAIFNASNNNDGRLVFQEAGINKWFVLNDGDDSDRFKIQDNSTNTVLSVTDQGSTADFAFNTDDLFVQASNGFVGINNVAPGATLDVNGNILLAGGGTIDARASGTLSLGGSTATTISLGRTGQGITLPGFTGQNGILYGTNSTGVLAQATTSTGGQCLLSGASNPAWGTCPGAGAGSSNWRLNLGTISPNNDTLDLLVGSNATASAKFAVLNVSSGTPVASISAGTSGATYLTANGTLATTAMQSLNIGNATTGKVNITSGSLQGISVLTGNGTTSNTGALALATGTTTSGTSGLVSIFSGNAAGSSGAISQVGTTKTGSNNLGTTTQSVTFDSIPQDGDIILLTIASDDSPAPSPPAGFSQLYFEASVGAGTDTVAAWYKRASGEVSATYTVTFAGTNYRESLIGSVFRGAANTGNPFEVVSIGSVGYDPTPVAPSITTLTDNAWHIAYFWINEQNLTATSAPAGYTKLGGVGVAGQLTSYKVISPAGSTGTTTITGPGTHLNIGISLSLKPGTTGGGSGSVAIGSGTSTGSVGSGTLSLTSGNTDSGTSGNISILSGNSTGGGTSGNILIDAGSASGGTLGSILIGNTNAQNITLGRTGQGITLPGFDCSGYTNGGKLTTTSGGVLACANDGGGGGSSNWRLNLGTISPNNNTLDLLVGSNATASAKFAILNVNGARGTQTASISGNLTLDANASIQTTRNQGLTIGGSTTGDIRFATNVLGAPVNSGLISGFNTRNTALGYSTATLMTGTDNTSIGALSGSNITSGAGNTMLGALAGANTSFGTFNTFVGHSAGIATMGGSYNIAIGYSSGASTGALRNTTAIGTLATVDISDALVLGGTGENAVWVGIGTSLPTAALDVQGGQKGGRAAAIINQIGNSANDIFSASASGTTRFLIANDGRIGINTAASPTGKIPTAMLQVFSSLGTTPAASIAARTAAPTLLVNQDGVGDLFVASSGGQTVFRVKNNGDLVIGPDGTGKITNGVNDPLYTIDGKRYSTYAPSMLGMKEEITEKATLTYNQAEGGYAYVLDFNNFQKDSDLWVFSRVIDPDINFISALISPNSQARTWYKKDTFNRRIVLYSDRPTEVSYRLTAPRFDHRNIPTISDETETIGIVAPDAPGQNGNQNNNQQDNFFSSLSIQWESGAYKVKDGFGNAIERAEGFSDIIVGNLRTGFISAKNITSDSISAGSSNIGNATASSLSFTTDNITIAGQNLRDFILATVQNAGFTNSSNGIVSPLATIDQINTNRISPLAQNSSIELNFNADSLEVKNTNTQEVVARIDDEGNASFSGTLTANEASVSGNLASDTLIANDATISGTLYANNIDGLDNKISSIAGNLIASQQPTSTISGQIETLIADNINAEFGVFEQGIMSLGAATFGQVTAIDSISVGTSLTISENSINTLGNDLSIQPLAQGNVNFMAGKVVIDTDGNMSINGNLNVLGHVQATKGIFSDIVKTQKLASDIISPLTNKDLAIQLGQDSASNGGSLKIKNPTGNEVASINSEGDLVSSGSARFGKLNFNLVGQAEALSPTQAVATGSAGFATLKRNQVELTIQNPNVTADSLIYITPFGNTNNKVIYLLRQTPHDPDNGLNGSFTVGISGQAPSQDLQFNWLIVN